MDDFTPQLRAPLRPDVKPAPPAHEHISQMVLMMSGDGGRFRDCVEDILVKLSNHDAR
jgi:hypothetical protein